MNTLLEQFCQEYNDLKKPLEEKIKVIYKKAAEEKRALSREENTAVNELRLSMPISPFRFLEVGLEDLFRFADYLVQKTITEIRPVIKAAEEHELISTADAARILGVCTKTIYRMKSAGIITPIRLGGQDRYKRRDIITILNREP